MSWESSMNASLSSRREFVPEASRVERHGGTISILAFVAGAVLMSVAVRIDSSIPAIPGFAGIVGALLYWNTMFWSAVLKYKK